MKHSEEDTKNLKSRFEDEVLGWPFVVTKKMFGHHCYQVNGKLFAFLETDGLVLTKLAEADRETLSHQYQTASFKSGRKTIQSWVKLAVKNKSDLDRIMPYVRKSYESAQSIIK